MVLKVEPLDDLNCRSHPSLELFHDTRRKMKKTPYNELRQGDIIDVFNEDKGDMDIVA